MKSQIATSSSAHGGRRKLPWAFTEHGAIMAPNVLNSPQEQFRVEQAVSPDFIL
ncbi:MAG: hypothetical protein AAB466_14005 [Verrucomicrobiota bacterium]